MIAAIPVFEVKLLYSFIYCRPLWQIYLAMGMLFLLWLACSRWSCGKQSAGRLWRYANLIMMLSAVYVIVRGTLLTREGVEHTIIWQPFYLFTEYGRSLEAWRLLIMNAFLFFPFGLTLPAALGSRLPALLRVGITILAGALLSAALELLQYRYCLGVTELDDVIWNTLGTAAASLHTLFIRKQSHSGEC